MSTEIWKEIRGYEGLYKVSNLGRVKSDNSVVMRSNGAPQTFSEKIIAQRDNSNGYYRVTLWKDGKQEYRFVHRLVAEAFVQNVDNKPVVDHIDFDRHNNKAENLRWCTQAENLGRSRKVGRIKRNISEEMRRKQKDRASKPVRRSDGKIFKSISDAARSLNVTHSAVSHALHNWQNSKACKGYAFEFVDEGSE